jgi:hypothetical protein
MLHMAPEQVFAFGMAKNVCRKEPQGKLPIHLAMNTYTQHCETVIGKL